ncbi:MAG TPA: hypothetical protein EYP11_06570 [Aquificaceae bacterium]|nr:hypothetical protein [Aquificaceae bacterium]
MKRGAKFILGLATLVPAVYFPSLLFTPLGEIFSTSPVSPEAPLWVLYFAAFHFFMYLYMGFLLALYMINLLGRKDVGRTTKALWSIALVVGNVLTMLLYWYLYIHRSSSDSR